MPEQTPMLPKFGESKLIESIRNALSGRIIDYQENLYINLGKDVDRKKILTEEFIALNKDEEYVIIVNTIITKPISFYSSSDRKKSLLFYNCILADIIYQESQAGNLYFYYTKANIIKLKNNSAISNFQLSCNSEVKLLEIINKSKCNNIDLLNDCKLERLSIENESGVGIIGAMNFSEIKSIHISDNSNVYRISILNNSLCSYLNIKDSSKISKIIVYDNSYTKTIDVAGHSNAGLIQIEKNSSCEGISLSETESPSDIIIRNNCKVKRINFYSANIGTTTIEDNLFSLKVYNTKIVSILVTNSEIVSLEWEAGSKGELLISNCKIYFFLLGYMTLQKDTTISLNNVMLKYFILDNLNIQGQLLLREVQGLIVPLSDPDIYKHIKAKIPEDWAKKYWSFTHDFYVAQKRKFDDEDASNEKMINSTPTFRIIQSSLGKTEITGSDLTGFKFEYFNSKLLDCFITGTRLPKDNIAIYNPAVPDTPVALKDEYEQKTSVYNQFKKIYENQGDVVEASEFHAMAMRYQQKLLWWKLINEKNGFWKKVKMFFENAGFRLNWMSNNHGESWFIALAFTIGVSLLFFTASLWGLTHFGDWKVLNENIHKLPGFMLPIHKLDFLSEDIIKANPALKVSLWHTTWDFLGRIFVGYGIFQFISAFRRHGKKGG